MKPNSALITGYQGFIGSRLDAALDYKAQGLERHTQVKYAAPNWGPVEVVYHLGARVGMGESQYRIADYCEDNVMGTARLLEALPPTVEHMVLASSVSAMHGGSPYAATKACQEELCAAWCDMRGVTLSILRLYNVYGPGQSLTNPYTGVAAIFAQRLLRNEPPIVFEDGLQTRDFVHVDDVARAMVMAADARFDGIAEIGSGRPTTIIDVATELRDVLGGPLPIITGERRKGDFRHGHADLTAAAAGFGWEPLITFRAGIAALGESLRGVETVSDVEGAIAELRMAGGFA